CDVDEYFAVLPISERCARFESLVAGVGSNKGFVQNQSRIFEPRIQIADHPFILRTAHRQAAMFCFGEIAVGPLQFSHVGNGWAGRFLSRFWLRHWRSDPDVSFDLRVWATRAPWFPR